MTGDTLGDVIRRIGRSAALQHDLTLTDAQLLERFVARRDEPAFAALAARHGPMVLGVCRRLVRDAQEAEDAFQATFLILARKAAAIQKQPLLAGWLYGVAYRVAVRLRGQTARRRTRERHGADLDALPADDASWSDAGSVVHEEVGRLPDAYRAPVILCYLEGKTNEEAASLLRSPVGTVKGRLTRAREMLRARLTRRGVTASEGIMATALAAKSATAPAKLVDATIRAATRFAAGEGGVGKLATARALALSQGVLRTMMLTKVKIAGVLLLAATMLGGSGAGWLAFRAPAEELRLPPVAKADDKSNDKSNDDKDAIQGTWKVMGVEMGGKEAPDNANFKEMKSATWTITADKITVAMPKEGKDDASYKLDPTKNPKHLDFTALVGPKNEKGKTGHGVYSLEGDVLKVCMPMSPDADERPKELRTKEGDKAVLLTLKREKPAKDKPKADKPEADKLAIQGVWQVTAVETNDKKTSGRAEVLPKIKTQQWTFAADKVTIRMPGEKDIAPAAYTLDPSTTPKEIDLTPVEGNGRPQQGVYSLDGDILKLCFAGPQGGPRPTELAADEASKDILLTFKRVTTDKEKPKEELPPPPTESKVQKLARDLCQAAKEEYKQRMQRYLNGVSTSEQLAGASRRVLTAELEQSEKKEDRVTACEEYLQRTTEVAKHAMAGYKAGQATQADALQAEYYRLEAEIMLEREKAK